MVGYSTGNLFGFELCTDRVSERVCTMAFSGKLGAYHLIKFQRRIFLFSNLPPSWTLDLQAVQEIRSQRQFEPKILLAKLRASPVLENPSANSEKCCFRLFQSPTHFHYGSYIRSISNPIRQITPKILILSNSMPYPCGRSTFGI